MKGFVALGKNVDATRNLEWFPLSEDELYSGTALDVSLECTEFTCRCPVTNQPDWAKIYIDYGALFRVVESKSVKLYLETYREVGIFHERLARRILRDFVEVLEPRWCTVKVVFNTRGGIAITAKASYEAPRGPDVPCGNTWDEPAAQVEHAVPFPDSIEEGVFVSEYVKT